MIDVSTAVTAVAGAASAVGAVGSASLAVKVFIETFKRLREAGLSPTEACREAQAEKRRVLAMSSEASARQRGKDLDAEQYLQFGNVEADRAAMDASEQAMAEQFEPNPNWGRD